MRNDKSDHTGEDDFYHWPTKSLIIFYDESFGYVILYIGINEATMA